MDDSAQTIENLIRILGHPRRRQSERAERRLIAIGSPAVPALIEAAASPSKDRRLRAAWALGKIGDPRGYNAILSQLNDRDDFVRYEAAYALANLGDVRAIDVLIRIIDDGSD